MKDFTVEASFYYKQSIMKRWDDVKAIENIIWGPDEDHFYTLGEPVRQLKQRTDSPIAFTIQMDTNAMVYSRKVFSLVDFAIAVGSIMRALYYFGLYATAFFAKTLYQNSIISSLFLITTEPALVDSLDNRRRRMSTIAGQEASSIRSFKDFIRDKDRKKFNSKLLTTLTNSIVKRRPFKLSTGQAIVRSLCCCKSSATSSLRHPEEALQNKARLLLNKELDII